ncbi:MAG: PIN domain-containing protein [Archaeoglobaceae archaeon]|nr:PIN domain-containing protein [Archaeoglobaceae archaeon]
MSRIFLDSSILVESLKGNDSAVKIIEALKEKEVLLVINPIVFSEVTYLFMKYVFSMLNSLAMFDVNAETVSIAEELMLNYNLLPNDALILATCKYYGIKYLASLDTDFEKVCEAEKINLINNPEKAGGIRF